MANDRFVRIFHIRAYQRKARSMVFFRLNMCEDADLCATAHGDPGNDAWMAHGDPNDGM